jgi:membrane protein
MFMIWLYVSWLILLVGAQISFYHQYPYFLDAKNEVLDISHRLKEKLTFLIMYFIAYNFHNNKKPWTLDALVAHLELPVDSVHDIIINLEKNSFLLETGDDPPAFIPARELETISLRELMFTARMTDTEARAIENHFTTVPEVDGVLDSVETAVTDTLGKKTLKDLVDPAK